MSFLNAEWRKLILINYEIDPEILNKYLPAQTSIDLFEGKCYVSVVGFCFKNTKMLGMKIPFHINFEEINLRFYVEHKGKRGVVFIQEIVPKRAISTVANLIYKEHYVTRKMKHEWIVNKDQLSIKYAWKHQRKWQSIEVKAVNSPAQPIINSLPNFISEHYWGYTRINNEKSFEYEVKHPTWDIFPVTDYTIDVDFEAVYGKDFAFLSQEKPSSIFLAEGSEISVEKAFKV